MKNNLATWGRVLYALPFGIFGIFHLMQAKNFADMVPQAFPGSGVFWAYLTGVVFLLVAASLLSGRNVKQASLLLAFQLLVFILVIWIPGIRNPEMQQIAMVNLLKDTALIGAALTLAAMAGHHEGSSHDHSHDHAKGSKA